VIRATLVLRVLLVLLAHRVFRVFLEQPLLRVTPAQSELRALRVSKV